MKTLAHSRTKPKIAKARNYAQKFRDTFQVSDIQELVDTAGVASEFANAESKAVRNVKRSIEAHSVPHKTVRPKPEVARLTKLAACSSGSDRVVNLPTFLPLTKSVANDTTGTQTETTFNSVLQELYEANGMPGGQLTLIAGPSLKQEISNFSRQLAATNGTHVVNQDAESRKITMTVSLYEGDFGTVSILPSLFVNRTSGSDTIDGDAGLPR